MNGTASFFLFMVLIAGCVAGYPQEIPNHPRILFLKDDEKLVREMIWEGREFASLHQTIVKESDAILRETPVGDNLIGRRLLKNARESRRRIFFLSYAYRMTGEERYLRRAEDELLTISGFKDWNPGHFIDVAEFTMAAAVGYDWLYHGLSSTTRSEIIRAIVEKGLKPSLNKKYNSWLNNTNNWNQVCNAGMFYGALAVLDVFPSLASEIIERSINSLPLAMNEYEPDGGYPEGYGYWGYGTTFNVLMLSALEKVFPAKFNIQNYPGFLTTGKYLLHMSGLSGNNFNYSDNHPHETLNPAAFWLAAKNNDLSTLYIQKRILNKARNLHRVRELPVLMIWGIGIDMRKVVPPEDLMWVGKGKNQVASIRSDWDARKGIYIGFKAGSPSYNHGHMDVGSFVLDALGERWAVDLAPQDYHSLESAGLSIWRYKQSADRWKVFRFSNFAHNTLTINKGLQLAEKEAFISRHSHTPGLIHSIADLTPVYKNAKKILRGVAILDEQYAIVNDQIMLDTVSTIRWQMLTRAEVVIHDNTTAELRQNGKRFFLKVLIPEEAALISWKASPPEKYDADNPGVTCVGFAFQTGPDISNEIRVVFSAEPFSNKKAIPPMEEWP